MKLSIKGLIFFAVIAYGLCVYWVGCLYLGTSGETNAFEVMKVQPDRKNGGDNGAEVWTVSGHGFNRDMRVLLSEDLSNRHAVVGTVPLGGNAYGIVMGDGVAYVSNATQGLQLLSMSDPESPAVISRYYIGANVHDVYLHDKLLFLLTQDGVSIKSVKNPTKPQFNIELKTFSQPYAIRVVGDLAYVAAGKNGLMVFDISMAAESFEQQAKTEISPAPWADFILEPILTLGSGSAYSLDVAEDRLYVGYRGKFRGYRLDSEGMPEEIYSMPISASVKLIKRVHSFLFVNDKHGELNVYRERGLLPPILTSRNPLGGDLLDIILDGNLVYLALANSGLVKAKMTENGELEVLGSVKPDGPVRSICIDGNWAFLVCGAEGVKIVDLSRLDNSASSVAWSKWGKQIAFFRKDHSFYLSRLSGGFFSGEFDQQTYSPRNVTFAETDSAVLSFEATGARIFTAMGNEGVVEFAMQADGAPVETARLKLPGFSKYMAIFKKLLVVSAQKEGIHLVDISEPGRPRLVKTLPSPEKDRSCVVENGFLYVATRYDGVLIYDLNLPDTPLVNLVEMPWPQSGLSPILGLDVATGYLYMVTGQGGLKVVDVRNPYQPEIVNSLSLPGMPNGIYVDGNRAYTRIPRVGIAVVDISNPQKPEALGVVPLRLSVRGIESLDEKLLVFTRNFGLMVTDKPQELGVEYTDAESLRIELPALETGRRYTLHFYQGQQQERLDGVISLDPR